MPGFQGRGMNARTVEWLRMHALAVVAYAIAATAMTAHFAYLGTHWTDSVTSVRFLVTAKALAGLGIAIVVTNVIAIPALRQRRLDSTDWGAVVFTGMTAMWVCLIIT